MNEKMIGRGTKHALRKFPGEQLDRERKEITRQRSNAIQEKGIHINDKVVWRGIELTVHSISNEKMLRVMVVNEHAKSMRDVDPREVETLER